MDEYLDFSFQADRFDGICKYKYEKEAELYSIVDSIQNNIFNKGTSIKDINDLIKKAVNLLKIINEQRDVMFNLENTINSKVAMINEKIGTSERISALTSLRKSKKKYDILDMYVKRDLLFRAMNAVKYIELIRPASDEDSFDEGLYNEYCKGLAEIDLDLYYRMAANDKTEELEKFKELHDYKHVYTIDDIEELCNPIVESSEKTDEEEIIEEMDIEFEDEDEEIDDDLSDSIEDEEEEEEEEEEEKIDDAPEEIDDTTDEFVFTDIKRLEVENELVEYAKQLINMTGASDKDKKDVLDKISGFIEGRTLYWQKSSVSEEELKDNIEFLKNAINKNVVESLGEPVDDKTIFIGKLMAIKDEELSVIPEDSPLYAECQSLMENYVKGTISILDAYDYKNHSETLLNNTRDYLNRVAKNYLERIALGEAPKEEPESKENDVIDISGGDSSSSDGKSDEEELPRFPFGKVDKRENESEKEETVSEDEEIVDDPIIVEEDEEDKRYVPSEDEKSQALHGIMGYALELIDKSSISESEKESIINIVIRDIKRDFETLQKNALTEEEFNNNVELLKMAVAETISSKLGIDNKDKVEESPDSIPEDIEEEINQEPIDDGLDDIPEDVVEDIDQEPIDDGLDDIPEDVAEPIIEEPVQNEIKTGGRVSSIEGNIYYMIFKRMAAQNDNFTKETFNGYLDGLASSDKLEEVDKKHIKIRKNDKGYYAVEYENGVEVNAFELSWVRFKRFSNYKDAPQEMKEFVTYPGRKIQQQKPGTGTKLFTLVIDGYMEFDQKTQTDILKLKVARKLSSSPNGSFKMPEEGKEPTNEIVIPVYAENGEPVSIQLIQEEYKKGMKM